MEGGLGQSYSEANKSRVLDVKPLRCWAPVFPKSPQSPLLPNSASLGSSQLAFNAFYPSTVLPGSDELNHPAAAANGGSQNGFFPFGNPGGPPSAAAPAPIRSYKSSEPTPAVVTQDHGASNGDVGGSLQIDRSDNASGSVKRKRTVLSFDGKSESRKNLVCLDTSQREEGSAEIVEYVRMMFDAVRRRLSQLEEAKEALISLKKRPDLKAGSILMSKGIRTNMIKRTGTVPGVEIGDIFFFRMEMCLVGLHGPCMAGIDYLTCKGNSEDEPLALSIVSSGVYDDEAEDKDVLIYTGQGGVRKKQVVDQKLEKGNLALERSLQRANEIRVIRGMKDLMNPSAKVYVYDGLYKVQESWTEKGRTGGNIFKYKLVRIAHQPSAFSIWKSVEKWKHGFGSRVGLILPDLASGAENLPVSLVNDVDNDRGPSYFTYFPSVKYSKPYTSTTLRLGCNCHTCTPGDLNCCCIRKNDGDFPYLASGVLVSRRPMLYECSPLCPCFPNCKNRVSQTGLKFHLEVFKTTDRGWGLRSWDPIRAGAFICEYAGEVVDKLNLKRKSERDDYIFDTGQHNQNSLKWNYEPALLDEEKSGECTEDYEIPVPLTISAKKIGNVARFMNHSCNPNIFWQPVMYEHNSEPFLHIAFFAIKNIPPMTELTFDYGITPMVSHQAHVSDTADGKKKCLCKSANCRGYFR
uniref:Uncharacterized protein n=1 Tax=Kalanchoe fedtschenkoi TaxID=63787 RepID=A0A7N0T695_KALFE